MRVRTWLVAAVAFCALWAAQGRAAYVITPTSGGASAKDVAPGGAFSVQVDLSGAETCDSVIFDVVFSQAGLKLESYTWGGSFNGSAFDNSSPPAGSLPVRIDAGSHAPTAAVVDLHFENFTPGSAFGAGTLLTLNLSVPGDFTPVPTTVLLSVVPDTFTKGIIDIPTTASGTLNVVVPEPATVGVMAVLGGLAVVGRRRSR